MILRNLSVLLLACLFNVSKAEELVKAEILTLNFAPSSEQFFFRGKKEVKALNVSSQGMSSPILYHGNRVLRLYATRQEAAHSGNPKSGVAPQLTIKLPLVKDRVLILFSRKGKASAGKLSAYVVDISTNVMLAGDYRVFNFSKSPMLLRLDDKVISLKPGQNKMVQNSKWKNEVSDIVVALAMVDGVKKKTIYQSIWGHQPNVRTFIFCVDRRDRYQPIEMRSFFDIPSLKSKELSKKD